MRRALARIAGAAAAGVAAVLAGCQIDSQLMYHPQPLDEAAARAIAARHPEAEEVEFRSADGKRLHGWLIGHRGAAPRPLVIYYGGNAEEVSWILQTGAPITRHAALLLVNYRGYGRSQGKPHEDSLYADALAVFDAVGRRAGIDARRIVLWGRSLGSGVAVHVAAQRAVHAVVLVSPYDSMRSLAQRHYPAISFLLSQPYDSLVKAPGVKVPALALAGGRDSLIPLEHSERLGAAWGGRWELARLVEADHNSISAHPGYWPAIETFLRRELHAHDAAGQAAGR